jgi:hypothetical protein
MHRLLRPGLALLLLVAPGLAQDRPPTPEAHLGYRPGADFQLVAWPAVVDFFKKVDATSDRVHVQTLGESTEGRPFVVAVVSSPGTIRDLDRFKTFQRRLSHPDPANDDAADAELVGGSKPVVLITCSIHSTETASTFMAMELLHELATRDDAATREILDGAILLLVPSVNPDGVDKVKSWYDRSKGRPWEGSGMVELYHKYAGHDTNRDWFALNLQETRLLTRLLYREWFPTITYDVHQMGSTGARLFVPPFFDPINPNLDPRIHQSIAMLGAHMAADLAVAGKRGILTGALYDNWWNGGNRTTPQRHNMVGLLTEAASVRMASPIFLTPEGLGGAGRGFRDHRPAVNFPDPWPGGWWRLRDIVDYELICARSALTLAARYREHFQRQYLALSRDAIRKGRDEPPFAWVVPPDESDPARVALLVRTLHDTGIEVKRATTGFRAGGASYPAGTYVLPAAQPYRAHLKDMMERQDYPERLGADGEAEPPYDVAGWTLPLLFNVRTAAIADRLTAPLEPVEAVADPAGTAWPDAGDADYLVIPNRANSDARLRAILADDPDVRLVRSPVTIGDVTIPAGAILVPKSARRVTLRVLGTAPAVVGITPRRGRLVLPGPGALVRLRPTRIGVYQPWVPSMDEGWTRLVLENAGLVFATLHNADIRAGDLKARVDTIVLPSVSPATLSDGYAPGETEPAYTGGLGREGAEALGAFVRAGGTLVCLETSSRWAIRELGLPVTEVLGGLKSSEFYCPGSILRAEVDPRPEGEGVPLLTAGVPESVPVYFDRSLAFEVPRGGDGQVALRYAEHHPLLSGWLLGASKLQGKAALVEVPLGAGQVVLFAFPPQHRGQTHGTFRLLYNALLRGGTAPAE